MAASPPVIADSWKELKRHTNARIAMGRAGGSIPTRELLAFRQDHARARDAVHIPLDTDALKTRLEALGTHVILASSRAGTRDVYLKRPDLGRCLSTDSRERLTRAGKGQNYDIALIVADGLSAVGVGKNAVPLLEKFMRDAKGHGLSIAPLTIIRQGRVASGDEVAQLLNARIAAILIGERPGLSSPDSMGLYMTFRPEAGATTDERRNCISNIRDEGLPPRAAADKLLYLVTESLVRQISGVNLKDMQDKVFSLP